MLSTNIQTYRHTYKAQSAYSRFVVIAFGHRISGPMEKGPIMRIGALEMNIRRLHFLLLLSGPSSELDRDGCKDHSLFICTNHVYLLGPYTHHDNEAALTFQLLHYSHELFSRSKFVHLIDSSPSFHVIG